MESYISLDFDHEHHGGLESRASSGFANILKGPFVLHNFLVANAQKLKKENDIESPNLIRIFPLGGSKSLVGDLVAFVLWLLVVAYSITTIPVGCYCSDPVNVVNAIVLSAILISMSTMGYLLSRNMKWFNRMCCIVNVPGEKCLIGAQNRFLNLQGDDVNRCEYLNGNQKKQIHAYLDKTNKTSLVIMLCSRSYWRSRVMYPSICLAVVCTVCLVAIIIQLEFIKKGRSMT